MQDSNWLKLWAALDQLAALPPSNIKTAAQYAAGVLLGITLVSARSNPKRKRRGRRAFVRTNLRCRR